MTTLPTLQIILIDKNYYQIATNVFERYADKNFVGKFFWRFIKINFKYWTKKYWDIYDNKIWNKILGYCILCGVWIEENNNHFEVLIKLILALTYDINLEDWDMNYIDKVAKTFDKVSSGIFLWVHHLQGNKLEEIQQF